jgi:hypothetical protein
MRVLRMVLAFEAIAVALWLGGLITLGAIVAPTVFGMVPAPTSADAMTVVFQRFDRLAMTAAMLALLCEVASAKLRPTVTLLDLGRAVFTPEIASLHQRGAIRGSGELGLRLETVHVRSEVAGKAQFALGVAFFGLLVSPGGLPQARKKDSAELEPDPKEPDTAAGPSDPEA